MISQVTIDTVAQMIRTMSNNALNIEIDTFQLIPNLPNVPEDDFAEALLRLESKILIKVLDKKKYHSVTLVTRFTITPAFINTYP